MLLFTQSARYIRRSAGTGEDKTVLLFTQPARDIPHSAGTSKELSRPQRVVWQIISCS